MSEKTILLATGWDTVNIGDIGHTPGTLRVLEQYLPDVRVIAWVYELNEAIEAMLRRRFPTVSIVRGAVDAAGDPTTSEVGRAFEQADVMIHNSSMGESTHLLRACRKRGLRYGMFGHSYFPRVLENQELMGLLHDASFVFCRETLTLEMLQRAGLTSPLMAFNPDGCFGIDVRDDAPAEAFLTANGLEDGRFMTLQLRTNTQKHPNVDSFLNPVSPSPQQQADDERRATILREVITGWVEQTGCKVLLAPEVQKEIAHNKRLLMDPLPARIRQHVVSRDAFWNVDEAASVFARAAVTVCHEPHSCIIAMANGTPVMHTYSPFHSPKYHMFNDIGLPEWLLPIDDAPAADMLQCLLDIQGAPDVARAKVRHAMDRIHSRFAETCRAIRRAL